LPENNHKLLEGLIAGQESSYNELFNEYYLVLTVYARKYLGDMDLSREVVQDMFVRLYESRSLLKNVSSLKGYLYRSVRNSCLNYIKLNKIRNKHKENIRLAQSGPEYDLTEEIQESELEQRIFQIVSKLPERCRDIFKLSRVDGLKNDEIAEKFNISKRTVETQISKALKILRLELASYLTSLIPVLAYVFTRYYLSFFIG
jgi:RNA polymerase sigma-70 factor (ECF subfamily)